VARYKIERKTQMKTKTQEIDLVLYDPVKSRYINAKIQMTPQGIGIGFDGYGDKGSPPGMGQPVLIEFYEGKIMVRLWADINQEDPTHQIDMSGAKESLLKDEPSPLDVKLLGKKAAKRAASIAPKAPENAVKFIPAGKVSKHDLGEKVVAMRHLLRDGATIKKGDMGTLKGVATYPAGEFGIVDWDNGNKSDFPLWELNLAKKS
jgi:hypothetical protein